MFTPSITNPTDPVVAKIADALDLARYLAQRGINVIGCVVGEREGQLLMKFRSEQSRPTPDPVICSLAPCGRSNERDE